MPLLPIPRPPAVAGALAVALTLAGCGTGTEPGPAAPSSSEAAATSAGPATTTDGGTMTTEPPTDLGPGAVLTPEDDGATLRLAPGEEASLRLPPPWDALTPEVSDPAVVELVPVDHFADPGYAEHGLLALAPGDVTLRVEGGDGPLELRVVVED